MSEINVRYLEENDVLVELSGDFDLHDLEDLRDALSSATEFGRPVVDLSGVTFVDIGATRELAVRAQLPPCGLTLRNPSPAVCASIAACGLEPWFDFCTGDAPAAVPTP